MQQGLFFRKLRVQADGCPFPPACPFVLIDLRYRVGVFVQPWGIHHLQLRNQRKRNDTSIKPNERSERELGLVIDVTIVPLSRLREVKQRLVTSSRGLNTLAVYSATLLFQRFRKYDYNLI